MSNEIICGDDSMGMTDHQFDEYIKVCSERNALLEENQILRENSNIIGEETMGMIDYQFKYLLSMTEKVNKLSRDNEELQKTIAERGKKLMLLRRKQKLSQ